MLKIANNVCVELNKYVKEWPWENYVVVTSQGGKRSGLSEPWHHFTDFHITCEMKQLQTKWNMSRVDCWKTKRRSETVKKFSQNFVVWRKYRQIRRSIVFLKNSPNSELIVYWAIRISNIVPERRDKFLIFLWKYLFFVSFSKE